MSTVSWLDTLHERVCCLVVADSIYNLREENKQLRKAHHDIHTQLQDAQVRLSLSYLTLKTSTEKCRVSEVYNLCVQIRHQDLKASHDQLALTLEDHKSALAAAQVGCLSVYSGQLVHMDCIFLCPLWGEADLHISRPGSHTDPSAAFLICCWRFRR